MWTKPIIHLFLFVSFFQTDLSHCLVVENEVCRNSNISALFLLPNQYTSDVAENENLFEKALKEAINICPNSSKDIIDYLCSIYYPNCENKLYPCFSFCEGKCQYQWISEEKKGRGICWHVCDILTTNIFSWPLNVHLTEACKLCYIACILHNGIFVTYYH